MGDSTPITKGIAFNATADSDLRCGRLLAIPQAASCFLSFIMMDSFVVALTTPDDINSKKA